MNVNCLNCDKEFKTFPSVIKKGYGKFCSISCGTIYNNSHEPKLKKKTICEFCGKEDSIRHSKAVNMDLCQKHYWQVKRHGKVFEKTRQDPNDIEEKGAYIEVILRDMERNEIGRAIIDRENYIKIKGFVWSLSNDGYAKTKIEGKNYKMHIYLFGKRKGLVLDHEDRNRLNNTSTNLRFVTVAENNKNRGTK